MSTTALKGITVRARQHEMLDALAWRTMGMTAGSMEAALDANPGLAKLGPHMPMGLAVRLVNVPQPPRETVNLWD